MMLLAHVRRLNNARLAVTQGVPSTESLFDRLMLPAAFVLASVGVGLSTYSVRQLILTHKRKSEPV